MTAAHDPAITLMLPLPPPALRSNSRAFWAAKVKAKQAYSVEVWEAWLETDAALWRETGTYRMSDPAWKRARVTYTWRHCGVAPDLGNLGGNTKALQDILCMAPKTMQANGTTYLGLIEDDKGITPEYRLKKVKHRAEQGVEIVIERIAD